MPFFVESTSYFSLCYFLSIFFFFFFFFLMIRRPPRSTPFPTRRSSDLHCRDLVQRAEPRCWNCREGCSADRKSTRLNSSHSSRSYAVFCLKKKKHKTKKNQRPREPKYKSCKQNTIK